MSKSLLILIELSLLLALSWYCIDIESGDIEADLTHRSLAVLGYAGLGNVTATARGQRIVLQGNVASPEQKRLALTSVASLWGVTEVIDELTLVDASPTHGAKRPPIAEKGRSPDHEPTSNAAPVDTTGAPSSPAETARCQDRLMAATNGADLRFGLGGDELTATSRSQLERIAAALRDCPGVALEIRGHTDSIGDAEDNKALSLRRARRVAEALNALGIDTHRLTTHGLGESEPIADNRTEQGRKANRRIEFKLHFPAHDNNGGNG